jgi:transcription elongation GreA/GreB family factor
VREADDGGPDEPLPDRALSEHPNYVTPAGLEALQAEAAALQQRRSALLERGPDPAAENELRHVERDVRYFAARLESAIVVDPAAQPRDEVAFGATVTVQEPTGSSRTYRIVGEDEADLASGKVSYVSPLAAALLGARAGERRVWRRPVGDLTLEVRSIAYDASRPEEG